MGGRARGHQRHGERKIQSGSKLYQSSGGDLLVEPSKTVKSFSDVKKGSYYEKAVKWAVEQGITAGTGNGKFSPESGCTRAQIVSFLYRAYQ